MVDGVVWWCCVNDGTYTHHLLSKVHGMLGPETISIVPSAMGKGTKKGITHHVYIFIAICALAIARTTPYPVRPQMIRSNNSQTTVLQASSDSSSQETESKFTLDTSDKSYTQLACLQLKTCQSCTAAPDCGFCVEYNGDATPQFTTTCMQSNENGVVTGAGEDGPDCREINKNFFYNNCIGYVKEN